MTEIKELEKSTETLGSITSQVGQQLIKNVDLQMKLLDLQLEEFKLLSDIVTNTAAKVDSLNQKLIRDRNDRERKDPMLRFKRLYLKKR